MVHSGKTSMLFQNEDFQDEDLMTLSSTYADVLATFGCRFSNTAFAQAVTGKYISIVENEHP